MALGQWLPKGSTWSGWVCSRAQRISSNPHLFLPLVLSPTAKKLVCFLPAFCVCVHAATYTCEHTCTHAATQKCVQSFTCSVTHAATLTHAQARIHTCRVTHVQTQPLTESHTRTYTLLDMSVDSNMLFCRLHLAQNTSRLKYAE